MGTRITKGYAGRSSPQRGCLIQRDFGVEGLGFRVHTYPVYTHCGSWKEPIPRARKSNQLLHTNIQPPSRISIICPRETVQNWRAYLISWMKHALTPTLETKHRPIVVSIPLHTRIYSLFWVILKGFMRFWAWLHCLIPSGLSLVLFEV